MTPGSSRGTFLRSALLVLLAALLLSGCGSIKRMFKSGDPKRHSEKPEESFVLIRCPQPKVAIIGRHVTYWKAADVLSTHGRIGESRWLDAFLGTLPRPGER